MLTYPPLIVDNVDKVDSLCKNYFNNTLSASFKKDIIFKCCGQSCSHVSHSVHLVLSLPCSISFLYVDIDCSSVPNT